MTCSIAMIFLKPIFNMEKKIPQNHFSCLTDIERKSADEPVMYKLKENNLKEIF